MNIDEEDETTMTDDNLPATSVLPMARSASTNSCTG